ncbi:alpha/beta hydrolase [Nocardia sp. NBC_01388]|uniref:alpha/beta hydrolase n=1 Tax=Nocardia sp. NBC_01388 TaxID=2903596 RepID=UPI003253FF9E
MSRATMSQVRGWDPAAAGIASDAVVEGNLRFGGAMRAAGRHVDAAVSGWRGAAATAAALHALSSQLTANHIGAAALDIADALADAAALAGVCATVRDIDDEAAANGCVIADDGTVTAPHADTGNAVLDLVLQACFDGKALALQARLLPLLDCAGETDQSIGKRLTAAVEALVALRGAPQGGPISTRVAAVLDGDAFLPEDPKALRALWESLAPADQDALFAFDPAIGNRDGIPAVARDCYNRMDLERLRAAAESDLRGLDAQHPDWARRENLPDTAHDWIALHRWDAERQQIHTQLAAYTAAADAAGGAGRYLLGVDNDGHGAIALNNPDAASNIATFVPGTGASLDGIGTGTGRARALLAAATKADRSARTSVIAWYGYESPPGLGNALSGRYADEGAVALGRFESGLRATHAGVPADLTVVGHSYGTTLMGIAAGHGNSLAADNLIFVGSPGVEVHGVSELRLDGIPVEHNHEHVYATADPADPVSFYARWIHGTDPVDPDFGATVFPSAGAKLNLLLLHALPYGSLLPFDPWAHGNYWGNGNPGLETQGEIITGRYRP